MKKGVLLFCCILCLQCLTAQRSSQFISQDRLFYEGKAMFDDRNFPGCINKLLAYKQAGTNTELVGEVDYLLAACAYYQGKGNALLELKDYLDSYPVTIHRNEICFMIGSLHFEEKDYNKAIYWLNQANLDFLSLSQQEEYAYRLATANLQTDKTDEAKRLFGLLKDNSRKYKREATYYLGYISHKENSFNQSLSYFNPIKDDPEFKEDILYYTTQINFAQKRYTQTISEGKKLLNLYPKNSNNGEVCRIIGLSYYQETNYPEAVAYLENGLKSSANYEREDYYHLGLSAYFNQQYQKAIEYLSLSNPMNDALGQNTYLYLGQAYLQQQDSRNALMAFGSASRLDFDLQAKEAAMYNYAMLLHQNSVSAFGESVTVLEDFLNTYPQSIYADKVNDALVDVYLTTKDYQTALNSIAKIRQPGRRILEARQKIYYYLGTVEFTNGNYEQAISQFTQAIEAGNYAATEKEEAIFWRGEAYYKKKDFAKANNDFQSFIQTRSQNRNLRNLAQYNLAYIAYNQKQYSKAQVEFQRFVDSEKGNAQTVADAYARLGDCYFMTRNFNEAEKAYNQAVAIMPSMGAYALYQKAYVMGLQKNYYGKIEQLDKLTAEYPQSPYITEALYEKGRSYVLLDKKTEAIGTFDNLWKNFPESSNARKAGLQIGMLYSNLNQPTKAAEIYKQVIAKYPGSQEARTAIQDLKSVYFEMNDVDGYAAYVRSQGGAVKFDVTEQDSLTYLAAERLFMRGETNQAQESLTRYLQSFATGAFRTNAHFYLGSIYYQEKNYPKADEAFLAVLEEGNNQFTEESVARLAEIRFNNQNYESALQLYERLQSVTGNQTNRNVANLGILRSASKLSQYITIITAAGALLEDESQQPAVVSEAKYHRAKAYLSLGENKLAENDLSDLAKDTRTSYGSEAKYLLAQYYFDHHEIQKSKDIVMKYIQEGTPHAYWLARSFILLSDIFKSEGDLLQARQYLESLQNNYKNTGDDIIPTLNERLEQLKN